MQVSRFRQLCYWVLFIVFLVGCGGDGDVNEDGNTLPTTETPPVESSKQIEWTSHRFDFIVDGVILKQFHVEVPSTWKPLLNQNSDLILPPGRFARKQLDPEMEFRVLYVHTFSPLELRQSIWDSFDVGGGIDLGIPPEKRTVELVVSAGDIAYVFVVFGLAGINERQSYILEFKLASQDLFENKDPDADLFNEELGGQRKIIGEVASRFAGF